MDISETARRNHDELFPDHASTLVVTDPELIEVFDNFAFNEVLCHIRLNTPTRLMVQLAALIACGALNEYRIMLSAALRIGVTPIEAKEIVYQAVPYVGMGRVFDFLHTTNEVLAEAGIALPLARQSTTTPTSRHDRGLDLQHQVVGAERVDAMYANARDDELHFQQLLSSNCFGDHLARTGVDLSTRELLTFAMLATLGGCDPQVRAHVAANLNVGNTRRQLLDVVTVLLPFIGYPRTLNALAAIDEITED